MRPPENVESATVPVTLGEIDLFLIDKSYVVRPKERAVTFLYVVAGKGHVESPERIALAPEILVVARKSPEMKVVNDGKEPLAFYVVRIPKKDSI